MTLIIVPNARRTSGRLRACASVYVAIYVSSYGYMCVLIHLCYKCKAHQRATKKLSASVSACYCAAIYILYVSSYGYICVLIRCCYKCKGGLLNAFTSVSSYMHTDIYICVFSYGYICVHFYNSCANCKPDFFFGDR
jgi:hypothetical protein